MEIIEAVNETVDATRCDHKGNCQNGAMCLTHDLWQELSHHIADYLAKITLADLVARDNVQTVSTSPKFNKHSIQPFYRLQVFDMKRPIDLDYAATTPVDSSSRRTYDGMSNV